MSKSLLVLEPADTAACCPPLSREPLSAEQAAQVAPLLKALADPVRLRLMSLIASHPGGEACVCDLNDAFDLSQPTISHHLKVLYESTMFATNVNGNWQRRNLCRHSCRSSARLDNEIRDSALNLIGNRVTSELEQLPTGITVPGIAMHPSGALVYRPAPAESADPTPNPNLLGGIDIFDARSGRLLVSPEH